MDALVVAPVELLALGHALLDAEHVVAQLQRGGQLVTAAGPPDLVADRRAHDHEACQTVAAPERSAALGIRPRPAKITFILLSGPARGRGRLRLSLPEPVSAEAFLSRYEAPLRLAHRDATFRSPWVIPPRFPILPRSRARSCSRASSSSTRARPSRTRSPPARHAAGRSTLRWPRSRRATSSPRSSGGGSFSLLLGLERLLSEEEPHLADGTVLSAHQVDALSGTLTALLAEAQRNGNGANGNGARRSPPRQWRDRQRRPPRGELASAAIPGEEDFELESDDDDLDGGEEDEEPQDWQDAEDELDEDVQLDEQPEDPNADRRFWFEHATGAGKTVAALGFVEASRTGGVLILTHRRNLVDQFNGELRDRGYRDRIHAPLLAGQDAANGPVTVETYQWFVRNAGKISDAYTIVICDEAHTALGEKTSARDPRAGRARSSSA